MKAEKELFKPSSDPSLGEVAYLAFEGSLMGLPDYEWDELGSKQQAAWEAAANAAVDQYEQNTRIQLDSLR